MDVPKDIQEEFTVHLVETMDEVLRYALTRPTVPIEDNDTDPASYPSIGDDPDLQQESVMH